MTTFGELSRPQKIAFQFGERHTELHIVSLMKAIDGTQAEVRQALPTAKDILKARYGLRLTPIIEREGWWTCDPSRRIAVIACQAAAERHEGEWQRNTRIYDDFGLAGEAAAAGRFGARGTTATIEDILEKEVAVSPDSDYVLNRVDKAIAVGRSYVGREAAA